jgi:hypothetical protein
MLTEATAPARRMLAGATAVFTPRQQFPGAPDHLRRHLTRGQGQSTHVFPAARRPQQGVNMPAGTWRIIRTVEARAPGRRRLTDYLHSPVRVEIGIPAR